MVLNLYIISIISVLLDKRVARLHTWQISYYLKADFYIWDYFSLLHLKIIAVFLSIQKLYIQVQKLIIKL